jgi:hypothetical protein
MSNQERIRIKLRKKSFPGSVKIVCSFCGRCVGYIDPAEAAAKNCRYLPCNCGFMVSIKEALQRPTGRCPTCGHRL